LRGLGRFGASSQCRPNVLSDAALAFGGLVHVPQRDIQTLGRCGPCWFCRCGLRPHVDFQQVCGQIGWRRQRGARTPNVASIASTTKAGTRATTPHTDTWNRPCHPVRNPSSRLPNATQKTNIVTGMRIIVGLATAQHQGDAGGRGGGAGVLLLAACITVVGSAPTHRMRLNTRIHPSIARHGRSVARCWCCCLGWRLHRRQRVPAHRPAVHSPRPGQAPRGRARVVARHAWMHAAQAPVFRCCPQLPTPAQRLASVPGR